MNTINYFMNNCQLLMSWKITSQTLLLGSSKSRMLKQTIGYWHTKDQFLLYPLRKLKIINQYSSINQTNYLQGHLQMLSKTINYQALLTKTLIWWRRNKTPSWKPCLHLIYQVPWHRQTRNLMQLTCLRHQQTQHQLTRNPRKTQFTNSVVYQSIQMNSSSLTYGTNWKQKLTRAYNRTWKLHHLQSWPHL